MAVPACLQVIHCIENGLPLLIENLPEDIDPVLDSVIQVGSGLARCGAHAYFCQQCLAWARCHVSLSAERRLLALALHNHAAEKSDQAWPGTGFEAG